MGLITTLPQPGNAYCDANQLVSPEGCVVLNSAKLKNPFFTPLSVDELDACIPPPDFASFCSILFSFFPADRVQDQ